MEKTLPEGKFSLYASWVAMKNLIYYLINRSDQPSDRHDRSYIFFPQNKLRIHHDHNWEDYIKYQLLNPISM